MENWSFQTLRDRLLDKKDFSTVTDTAKTFVGAAALLAGGPTGVATVKAVGGIGAALQALSEKEKLVDAGKILIQRIIDRQTTDYSGQVQKMKDAYGVLYFASFFDVLDENLPDDIRNQLKLSQREQEHIAGGKNIEICFPDIVYGIHAVDAPLTELYKRMRDRLRDFIGGLSYADANGSGRGNLNQRTFEECLKNLPKTAVSRFQDYFLNLCSNLNAFYVFVQLEQEKVNQLRCEEQYQALISAAQHQETSLESGFLELQELMEQLPKIQRDEKIHKVVAALANTYQAELQNPVAKKKGQDPLDYPPLGEAYIPHAFQLLRYTGNELLGQLATWKEPETYQYLLQFLAKYFLDPGSTENLLLILGEPGAGKSVLTKILCGRMSGTSSVFIRIPLRSHYAHIEEDIQSIILRQMTNDGGTAGTVETFQWFQNGLPDSPITLIFDGYDEILQATGGVYRSLLTRLHDFQRECAKKINRPVRMIVTSRDTLIDEAEIPIGTTVVKLREFDDARKEKWIRVWNDYNHDTLSKEGLTDFTLSGESKAIASLSQQPLLLLMLAIYDADFDAKRNALTTKEGRRLNRARLYDALLRRFIRRELEKGPRGNENDMEKETPAQKVEHIEKEMRRISIAALGMEVRRKLSLKVKELEQDLDYMETEAIDYDVPKNTPELGSGLALFGSFFFIHDPRSSKLNENEQEAAFEFLHKTFYEFLLADLSLDVLFKALDDLLDEREGGRNGEKRYQEALNNAEKPPFSRAYYAVLSGACLCDEPETVRMIGEWAEQKVHLCVHDWQSDTKSKLTNIFGDLFKRHSELVRRGLFSLRAWEMSGLDSENIGKRGKGEKKDDPQASAVYLLNLAILRVLIGGECRIPVPDWAWLSQYIRLNVPLPCQEEDTKTGQQGKLVVPDPYAAVVLRFMSMFRVRREGEDVFLEQRTEFADLDKMTYVEAREHIFTFLLEEETAKLYALHDQGRPETEKLDCLVWLDKNSSLPISYETSISLVYDAILNGRNGRDFDLRELLTFLVRAWERIPHNNQSALLEFLLLFRLLIDEKLCDKVELAELWDRIARSFYHDLRYAFDSGANAIVSIFVEITRKLSSGHEVLWMALEDLRQGFSLTPQALRIIPQDGREMDVFFRTISRSRSNRYPFRYTPLSLESRLSVGILPPSHPVWQDVSRLLENRLETAPEELTDFLRVCMEAGQYREVQIFLNLRMDDILSNEAIYKNPDVMGSLIEIATAVGAYDRLEMFWITNWSRFTYFASVSPNISQAVMLVLRKKLLTCSWNSDSQILLKRLIEHYDHAFGASPVAAVELLCAIADKGIAIDMGDFWNACGYSLSGFHFVLSESVSAAAQFLTLCIGNIRKFMGFSSRYPRDIIASTGMDSFDDYLAFCVQICINKAIALRDAEAIEPIGEIIDTLQHDATKKLKTKLMEYFEEIRPFLALYSQDLALKADELWRE